MCKARSHPQGFRCSDADRKHSQRKVERRAVISYFTTSHTLNETLTANYEARQAKEELNRLKTEGEGREYYDYQGEKGTQQELSKDIYNNAQKVKRNEKKLTLTASKSKADLPPVFDEHGFSYETGLHRDTCDYYDAEGIDREGADRDGTQQRGTHWKEQYQVESLKELAMKEDFNPNDGSPEAARAARMTLQDEEATEVMLKRKDCPDDLMYIKSTGKDGERWAKFLLDNNSDSIPHTLVLMYREKFKDNEEIYEASEELYRRRNPQTFNAVKMRQMTRDAGNQALEERLRRNREANKAA